MHTRRALRSATGLKRLKLPKFAGGWIDNYRKKRYNISERSKISGRKALIDPGGDHDDRRILWGSFFGINPEKTDYFIKRVPYISVCLILRSYFYTKAGGNCSLRKVPVSINLNDYSVTNCEVNG